MLQQVVQWWVATNKCVYRHHFQRIEHQAGMVANHTRGQLNREIDSELNATHLTSSLLSAFSRSLLLAIDYPENIMFYLVF